MKTTPSERIGQIIDFDTGVPEVGGKRYATPVSRPSMVKLRLKETGAVTSHFIIDAIEILTAPDTPYGLADGANYPESFLRRVGHGAEPPAAA